MAPDGDQWQVFNINNNDFEIKNVLINSSGFGLSETGEKIETSTLRFFFDKIAMKSSEIIERLDPSVLGLNNEYWISYWIDSQLYDRRFVFVPGAIDNKNMVYVNIIAKEAVLHA
mgnify:FL=1